MRAFLRRHSEKLLLIEDTPKSVAVGATVGIFLGFMPLPGLKTLLALGIAALLRVSKVASALPSQLFRVRDNQKQRRRVEPRWS